MGWKIWPHAMAGAPCRGVWHVSPDDDEVDGHSTPRTCGAVAHGRITWVRIGSKMGGIDAPICLSCLKAMRDRIARAENKGG